MLKEDDRPGLHEGQVLVDDPVDSQDVTITCSHMVGLTMESGFLNQNRLNKKLFYYQRLSWCYYPLLV